MKVIDNFLTEQLLNELDLFIQESMKSNGWMDSNSFYNHELGGSLPTGYTPFLFSIKDPTKEILLQYLKEKEIVVKEPRHLVCLLQCGFPTSNVDWHTDTHAKYDDPNAQDDFVVSGITVYMNKEWSSDWGGLFLYKSNKDDSVGSFVEPKYNRCVINNGIMPHSVSHISPHADKRISIQMFISTEALSGEFVNVS